MTVSVEICNLALGDIRAPAIADIAEDTVEASMCARYYPHCLAVLLDDYSWQFTKRIASLALFATNARESEWAYAYALPSDCRQALRLVPNQGQVIADTYYRNQLDLPPPAWWAKFIVEDGVLYCNLSDAVLEYASDAADEADFPHCGAG